MKLIYEIFENETSFTFLLRTAKWTCPETRWKTLGTSLVVRWAVSVGQLGTPVSTPDSDTGNIQIQDTAIKHSNQTTNQNLQLHCTTMGITQYPSHSGIPTYSLSLHTGCFF